MGSIFTEVNQLGEDIVAKYAGLSEAKDKRTWVCPMCGNGSHGRRGDGIRQKLYKGRLVWHCYSCDAHLSNADIIGIAEGITAPADLAKRLEELFPDFRDSTSDKAALSSLKDKFSNTVKEGEPRDYSRWYGICRRNLRQRLAKCDTIRGLTYETLYRAGAGLALNYLTDKYPPNGVEALILPYDKSRYFARSLTTADKIFTKGAERIPYIVKPLIGGGINFVTEGELDALSVAQAVGFNNSVGVGATGSKSYWRQLVTSLEATFAKGNKPAIIYIADNDDAAAARNYVDALRKAGYPSKSFNFAPYGEPKVDANDFLQAYGTEALRDYLRGIFRDFIRDKGGYNRVEVKR